MVLDSLHYVSGHLRVEECDRESHELGQEVGDQGDADPCGHVEHQPASDKVVGELAQHYHELGEEHSFDKSQPAQRHTLIDDGLGDERKDQAQQARYNHSEENLYDALFMRLEIFYKVAEIEFFRPFFFSFVVLIKSRSRFKQ